MSQPWETDNDPSHDRASVRGVLKKTKKVIKHLGLVFLMSSVVYIAMAKQSFKSDSSISLISLLRVFESFEFK